MVNIAEEALLSGFNVIHWCLSKSQYTH